MAKITDLFILNGADQLRHFSVSIGKGVPVDREEILINDIKKFPIGSTYTDVTNLVMYTRVALGLKASDWAGVTLVPATVVPSTVATVSAVKVLGVIAIPRTDVTKYDVELPFGTDLSEVTASDVIVISTDQPYATVGTPTTADAGVTWTVVVTAEDTTTKVTYTINATVAIA